MREGLGERMRDGKGIREERKKRREKKRKEKKRKEKKEKYILT